jgi:hypothetical protein
VWRHTEVDDLVLLAVMLGIERVVAETRSKTQWYSPLDIVVEIVEVRVVVILE